MGGPTGDQMGPQTKKKGQGQGQGRRPAGQEKRADLAQERKNLNLGHLLPAPEGPVLEIIKGEGQGQGLKAGQGYLLQAGVLLSKQLKLYQYIYRL